MPPPMQQLCAAARMFLKVLLHVHPLLFPRYMKEHTALALGIVAVLIVAIVMATKQLGCSTARGYQPSQPRTLWHSGFAHLDRGRRMGSPRSAQSPTYMLGAKLYHAGCCVACLHASSQS